METHPRHMPWHGKLADTLIADWQEGLQSLEFAEAWHEACVAFRVVMSHAQHRQFPLSDEESHELWRDAAPAILAYRDAYQRFRAFLPRYVPQIVAVYGRNADELLYGLLLHHCQLTPPPGLGERVERLAPDNPLRLTPEGAMVEWEKAKSKHLLQVQQYLRSFEIPKKGGRPRKPSKPVEDMPSGPTGSPAQTAQAYQLHLNGAPWHEIAAQLGITYNAHDAQDRKRIREHINRLIFSEKKRMNQKK
jgi:hypothetical protein